MQLKFTIRSLLLLVAVVAAGTSLQVRLQNVLSAVEHDFAHVGSSFHQQTIEEAKAELRSMHDTPSTYHAFEEKLARNQVKGTPSILDYCLFRREIEYNSIITLDCLRRGEEEYKNRELSPVQERHAGHATKISLETNVRISANPFGFTIQRQ